jgi:hypothetical protein
MAASSSSHHTPDYIPIIQYCYTDSRHFTLTPPPESGNYSRLLIKTPASLPTITLTPGTVHYIKTGIRINSMPPGYRFRIENSPILKETPFYILEYSNYTSDALYIKIVATRNMDLDSDRIIGQIVLEANPIILGQVVPVSHPSSSREPTISLDSESD